MSNQEILKEFCKKENITADTFKGWQKLGYTVNKGEKSKFTCKQWYKNNNGWSWVDMPLFTQEQVHKRANNKTALLEFPQIKVGTLFYSSWGYDCTNITFMQVIARKGKKSIVVREVDPPIIEEKDCSIMSRDLTFENTTEILPPISTSIFIKDNQNGDTKQLKDFNDNHPFFNIKSLYFSQYRGNKLYQSWY